MRAGGEGVTPHPQTGSAFKTVFTLTLEEGGIVSLHTVVAFLHTGIAMSHAAFFRINTALRVSPFLFVLQYAAL